MLGASRTICPANAGNKCENCNIFIGTVNTTNAGFLCQSWNTLVPGRHQWLDQNFTSIYFTKAGDQCKYYHIKLLSIPGATADIIGPEARVASRSDFIP